MAPSMSRCMCTSVQPWLISQQQAKSDKSTKGCTLFSPLVSSIKHKSIVELGGKIVVGSQHGWLIVVDSKDTASIFLFNPFSLATIDLPRLDFFAEELGSKSDIVNFVMTCVPDNDNIKTGRCVIVATCKSTIMFCCPGNDGGWGMLPARLGIEGVLKELKTGTMAICNGIIYALLSNDGELYLVKLIISNQQDDSDKPDLVVRLTYIGRLKRRDWIVGSPLIVPQLVESCGELYCVMLFEGDTEYIEGVRVTRFVQKDTSADIMVVKSLQNRALFVGLNCSSACFAPAATATSVYLPKSEELGLLEGNCVYIASKMGVNYVYRLQDRTLAPLVPILEMPSFWVTSATKKRNVDEGCNGKAKSHEEVKGETAICTIIDEASDWALPRELTALVATCMGLNDYSSFRSTCKKFRESTPPLSQWPERSLKMDYLKKHSVLPWLIQYNDDGICNVIDPYHVNPPYLMTTPDWDSSCANTNLDIACSKDGWLLMLGQTGHMFFYDPFNKMVTETKKYDILIDNYFRCVGYSAIPRSSSDECTIVALHSYSEELVVCSYVYGDENWHIFAASEHHPDQTFIPANNSPVYHKGAFYFLDMDGRLAQLTVTTDRLRWWTVLCDKPPKPVRQCTSSTPMETYLLECEGALWSVFVSLFGKWVKVFRLDFAKKRWSETYNLEKYMIFLSPRSSFAALAPTTRPDLGNKLYFSRLGGHQQHRCICYDLRSRTYCPSTPRNENFSETRELLGCAWIQPAWS